MSSGVPHDVPPSPRHHRSYEIMVFDHEGQRYKVGFGREVVCIDREQLGPVVEVFVKPQKVNSSVDVLASDDACCNGDCQTCANPFRQLS
jgi:hypothetical protein